MLFQAPCAVAPRGRRMIPALVVFLYLGGRPLHRHLRVSHVADEQRRRLFPGRPFARADRVPAVAVRHEHDGVFHPGRLRPCLRQRHRHVRADGVVVCACHSRVPVRHRHAPVGARQAKPFHDAGADVPRPVGVPPHRHRHLHRAGGAARALHHHRGHGRRHRASRDYRRRHSL